MLRFLGFDGGLVVCCCVGVELTLIGDLVSFFAASVGCVRSLCVYLYRVLGVSWFGCHGKRDVLHKQAVVVEAFVLLGDP